MDFTIITPSLNYGKFLGDCLASVAAQMDPPKERRNASADAHGVTMRDAQRCGLAVHGQGELEFAPPCVTFEHLVIDGGSTDDSAEVAARFPHVRWSQEPDAGMSDGINKGFEQAKGDWVIWLNADDRLKPGALAGILDFLKRSAADVVYGDYDFIDEKGGLIRTMKVPGWSAFVHIHHHCYVPSTAAFYRNATVIAAGHRLRVDFRYVMDGEFYARLDSIGKSFAHVPVRIADFRMHGGNASQRHLKKTHDMDAVLAAERQHIESRAIRRAYGITLFEDPYLNGLVDGVLWIGAKGWKIVLRCFGTSGGR